MDKLKYFFKYLSLSRNALIVVGGTLIAYLFSLSDYQPFILTGKVNPGLPPFKPPPFSTTVGNETYTFGDMLGGLGSSIITIPGIAILESIAIAKAFSRGRPIDATQEMIALGLCNIMGSFVSSMPVTGSFTRTAVNNASGVRTTAGGLVTGILIILALAVLTQTFYYIPKATLAAVIIAAMLFMTKFDSAVQIWRTKSNYLSLYLYFNNDFVTLAHTIEIDIIPYMVTLMACLFTGLEYGILIGIGVNLLIMLYTTSRPNIRFEFIKTSKCVAVMASTNQNLLFSSAEYFRIVLMKKVVDLTEKEQTHFDLVVINGNAIHDIDITVIRVRNLIFSLRKYQLKIILFQIIATIIDDIHSKGKKVLLWNWSVETRNSIIRFNHDYASLFKTTESLEDFVGHLELIGD